MSLTAAENEHRWTGATVRAAGTEQVSALLPPRTPEQRTVLGKARAYQCYCGTNVVDKSDSYCSQNCARNDAFSSLTHTRGASIGRGLADALKAHQQLLQEPFDDEASSRRMARTDHRREERREERRRRRPDPTTDGGNLSPVSFRASSALSNLSPSRVPELVSSHSRNTSNASSIFSLASGGSLSRNPSTSSSRHPNAASMLIDDAIMEDDGEDLDIGSHRSTLKAQSRRRNHASSPKLTVATDMRVHDMLDELINMEQDFRVSESPEPEFEERLASPSTPIQFTPLHNRPPRTPSPVLGGQPSMPPPAPNAPDRRSSLVHSRPSSGFVHQSSLSESHTALYLATASPMPSKNSRHRRSASPKFSVRRSISFTPSAAGPAFARAPRSRLDSPNVTPVHRRHVTPTAHHPAMDGWRFPTSNNVTPTRPAFSTPGEPASPIQPSLLWPDENADLGPAWSPGRTIRAPTTHISPPRSALRLGDLIRSGSTNDIDMDDSDDRSATIRGSILMAPVPPFAQRGW